MNRREKSYDAVDACVFSSDMLHNPEERAIFAGYLARWNTAFGETAEPEQAPTGQQAEPTDDDMDESGNDVESDSLEDRLGLAFARLGLLRGKTLLLDSEWQELTQARKAVFDALAALAGQQSERPAPAGQAVGTAWDRWQIYAKRAGLINEHGLALHIEKANTSWFSWQECERALAASQAELPAVKEGK